MVSGAHFITYILALYIVVVEDFEVFADEPYREVDEVLVAFFVIQILRQILHVRSEPWIRCIAFRLPSDMDVLEVGILLDELCRLLELIRVRIIMLLDLLRQAVCTYDDCRLVTLRFRYFTEGRFDRFRPEIDERLLLII